MHALLPTGPGFFPPVFTPISHPGPPLLAALICPSPLLLLRLQNVITPTTKAVDHDVPISPQDIVKQGLMSQVGTPACWHSRLCLFALCFCQPATQATLQRRPACLPLCAQSVSGRLAGAPRGALTAARAAAQPLFDLAFNPEEIKARLNAVPVFAVVNNKNEFVLVAGEVSREGKQGGREGGREGG